jgi:hypothetical protein
VGVNDFMDLMAAELNAMNGIRNFNNGRKCPIVAVVVNRLPAMALENDVSHYGWMNLL